MLVLARGRDGGFRFDFEQDRFERAVPPTHRDLPGERELMRSAADLFEVRLDGVEEAMREA